MGSKELERAIALQQVWRDEMAVLQTPNQFRGYLSRALGEFPTPKDVRFEPAMADGVPVHWMVPPEASDDRTVLYLHGGGYMIGSVVDYREMVPRIARAAQARALTVDYRLAPEHPHPAAVEDAVTAYRWLLANGGTAETTIVAGDSAGGGLAIATLVSLKDQGVALPAGCVSISPWVDLEMTGVSIEGNAGVDPLVSKDFLVSFAQAFLQGQDPKTPLAAPLHADLSGLPPILIQVGSIEVLLDDAKRLAERAKAAGTEAKLEVVEGVPHVWHWYGSFLAEARNSINRIGDFVRRHTTG